MSRHINSHERCLKYYCNAGLAKPKSKGSTSTASSFIFNLTTSFNQLIKKDTTSTPMNNPNNSVTQNNYYYPGDLGLCMSSSGK